MPLRHFIGSCLLAAGLWVASASPGLAYTIDSFDSKIEVARDTSLHIAERIEAVFDTPKHGIIRVIPVIYRSEGKNINSRVADISVTDSQNNPIKFSVSKSGNNLEIQIGDPDMTITGSQIYVISYTAKNILQIFPEHHELYWNVVGVGWDADIATASAVISSPYASVVRSDCFGDCSLTQLSDTSWQAVSTAWIPAGSDLTFVLGFDPNNLLVYPDPRVTFWQDEGFWILLIFVPAVIMAIAWWRRGRDDKFIGSNVYVQEAGAVTAKASPFQREHLPLVYSPIKSLTPAEVGTILDLRVDLADVVAEISELARLKFITIHKIQVKRTLLPDQDDYVFIKNEKKDPAILKPHQKLLFDSLFKSTYTPAASVLEKIPEAGSASSVSQLSKMTGHFYADLNRFRDKLYSSMTSVGYFARRPDHVQAGAVTVAAVLTIAATSLANSFSLSQMVWPWGFLSGAIAVLFGYRMGSRTAIGHALFRQVTGLKYFVGKGKWRYEIAEKNLFIEEILPLAVSLGVVSQLSRDMKNLQIEPPKYLGNMSAVDFVHFGSGVSKSLSTAPAGSSRGWSGGSGFSGGSSGGGFGGGGGRSW